MTCYVFCLGVNHYQDPLINSLKCAENDARKVAAAFEFRYGCVSEYLEERSSEHIIEKISQLADKLHAGDQFIFYFSGHGKVVGSEQLLLLPGCKLHLLEEFHACLRWATLKKLTSSAQWHGVQSLFIFDACRLPLEANKAAGIAEFNDGLLLRDPIFIKKPHTAQHALRSLFHSCAEGASAAEIPALKAGIFTQAMLDLIKAGSSPPSVFDDSFAAQVAEQMQVIAVTLGITGLRQQPVWVGQALALLAPSAVNVPPAPTPPIAASTMPSPPASPQILVTNLHQEKPANQPLSNRWNAVWIAIFVVVAGGLLMFANKDSEKSPQINTEISAPAASAPAEAPAASPAPAASASSPANEPTDAVEQNSLGLKYLGEKNYAEAVKWFSKAAEQGNAEGQANLGYMYDKGYGVTQDYRLAMQWFLKAAEQKNAFAQHYLGYMYEHGYSVKQDNQLAVQWYRKAAEQGNAVGQGSLGYMYELGYGVKQDIQLAVQWYRKAAEQGDATAQYNLGLIYRDGKGVKKDLNLARTWLQKAADQGFEDAKTALKNLNQ